MLTSAEIERHFSTSPARLLDIVLEVRSLVAAEAPDATERIRGSSLSYYIASRGGPVSAGVCGLTVERDQVRLYFPLGAFLPDPKRLLQGKQLGMRFINLKSFDDTPWEDLKDLIEASHRFDVRAHFAAHPTDSADDSSDQS